MSEQSSTFAQLRRDAEGWPAGLIMCDRDTFISLCDIADVARMAAEAPDEIERAKRLSDVRRHLGYLNDYAWNEWCQDTGCVPDGFHIHGPHTTRVVADFNAGMAFVRRVAAFYEADSPEVIPVRVRPPEERMFPK